MTIDTTKILVATGLKGHKNYSILDNVIGQMSDGKWENSRVMEHYWPFVEIAMDDSDNVIIMVHKPGSKGKYGSTSGYFARENSNCNNWFVNPFKNIKCSHSLIREFFAKKLQALVADERKSYPSHNIKFNANCDVESEYISDSSDGYKGHKISDIYNAYKTLKG